MHYKSLAFAALMISSLCLQGCSDNPGSWPQEKVEARVIESLDLTEITLSSAAESGQFTGSGKTAGGETFQLTVTQDPDTKKISWEATGDRGTTEQGSYSLE